MTRNIKNAHGMMKQTLTIQGKLNLSLDLAIFSFTLAYSSKVSLAVLGGVLDFSAMIFLV